MRIPMFLRAISLSMSLIFTVTSIVQASQDCLNSNSVHAQTLAASQGDRDEVVNQVTQISHMSDALHQNISSLSDMFVVAPEELFYEDTAEEEEAFVSTVGSMQLFSMPAGRDEEGLDDDRSDSAYKEELGALVDFNYRKPKENKSATVEDELGLKEEQKRIDEYDEQINDGIITADSTVTIDVENIELHNFAVDGSLKITKDVWVQQESIYVMLNGLCVMNQGEEKRESVIISIDEGVRGTFYFSQPLAPGIYRLTAEGSLIALQRGIVTSVEKRKYSGWDILARIVGIGLLGVIWMLYDMGLFTYVSLPASWWLFGVGALLVFGGVICVIAYGVQYLFNGMHAQKHKRLREIKTELSSAYAFMTQEYEEYLKMVTRQKMTGNNKIFITQATKKLAQLREVRSMIKELVAFSLSSDDELSLDARNFLFRFVPRWKLRKVFEQSRDIRVKNIIQSFYHDGDRVKEYSDFFSQVGRCLHKHVYVEVDDDNSDAEGEQKMTSYDVLDEWQEEVMRVRDFAPAIKLELFSSFFNKKYFRDVLRNVISLPWKLLKTQVNGLLARFFLRAYQQSNYFEEAKETESGVSIIAEIRKYGYVPFLFATVVALSITVTVFFGWKIALFLGWIWITIPFAVMVRENPDQEHAQAWVQGVTALRNRIVSRVGYAMRTFTVHRQQRYVQSVKDAYQQARFDGSNFLAAYAYQQYIYIRNLDDRMANANVREEPKVVNTRKKKTDSLIESLIEETMERYTLLHHKYPADFPDLKKRRILNVKEVREKFGADKGGEDVLVGRLILFIADNIELGLEKGGASQFSDDRRFVRRIEIMEQAGYDMAAILENQGIMSYVSLYHTEGEGMAKSPEVASDYVQPFASSSELLKAS